MKMMFWRILLKPVPPKTKSDGGIILPEDTIRANGELTQVAEVIDMGELAFTARTSMGYDYANLLVKPAIGSYVVIPKYGSRDIKIAGVNYKVVEDYEVLALADGPNEVTSYV